MAFTFENLDETTRKFMLAEVDLDVANERLYFSKRFRLSGERAYPSILREAIAEHDEVWLAQQLSQFMLPVETRTSVKGKVTLALVSQDAQETFANSEFNRFYIRGVAARALNEGIEEVEVYRGKDVGTPRPESQAKIGQRVAAAALLEDLRNSIGKNTTLGIPSGPKSGLTVRLPVESNSAPQ